MNIKNNLKYYWWEFKAQFLGGYEMFKETFDIQQMKENFKHNIKIMKENDEHDRKMKRYNNKHLLKSDDIIEFHQPENYGNVIKARVIDTHNVFEARWDWDIDVTRNGVLVEVEILESGLRNVGETRFFYQLDIMLGLISLNKEDN